MFSLLLKFQSSTRHVLRGGLQLNVGRTDLMKLFGHDVMRKFGFVAFAAQVGEVKMAQPG